MARPATLAIRITADASRAQRGANQAQTAISRLSGRLQSLGRVAGASAAVGVAAAGVALVGFGASAVSVAANSQRTEKALTGLYKAAGHGAGEAKKATQLLFDTFSSSTIAMESFQRGATNLAYLGLNAEKSTKLMKFLESAIVATGGSAESMDSVTGALQSISNMGKATLDEIYTISGAGVPILDMLAAKFGVSIPEAMEKVSAGGVGINDVLEALEEQGGTWAPALVDSAEEVEKSFSGVMASMKNSTINSISQNVVPALDKLAPMLEKMAQYLADDLIPTIVEWGKEIAVRLGPVLLDLGKFLATTVIPAIVELADTILNTVVPAIMDFAEWVAKTASDWAPLLIAIGAAATILAGPFLAALIAANVRGLVWLGTVKTVSIATNAWKVAQNLLNLVMKANPIARVTAAVLVIATAIYTAYQRSETFRNAVQSVWNWLKKFIGFTPLGALIRNWDKVTSAARSCWNRIKDVWSRLQSFKGFNPLGALRAGFTAVGRAITGVISKVKNLISWLGQVGGNIVGAITGQSLNSTALSIAPRTFGTYGRPYAPLSGIPVSFQPKMHVEILLDGRALNGVITKVVTRQMNDDGARLVAGGWA